VDAVTLSTVYRAVVIPLISTALYQYGEEHRMGEPLWNVGYLILPRLLLYPDVSFMRKGRLSRLPEYYVPYAPDLAVEVMVLGATIAQVEPKVHLYIKGEGMEDVLDGSDVLPGFVLPVSQIFPE
jgi:Uma2 family endonuclease